MRVTENDIIKHLRNSGDQYAPLRVDCLEQQPVLSEGFRADALIRFSIPDGPCFEALVEIVSVATPKNVLEKSRELVECLSQVGRMNIVPLLVAPYMGKKQTKIMADKGISWMDLSGNMSIKVSNQIYIERTGNKNRFPDTAPIKKIFQGTSSLVSRALLLKPGGFLSVNEVCNFINAHNANVTLSTVSKVLKSLEEELLITKSENGISATRAERLLERLLQGYENSTERRTRNTYRFAIENIQQLSPGIVDVCRDYLAFGFYAAQLKGLAVTDKMTIIVEDVQNFRKRAEQKRVSMIPDEEFGNAIITESKDPGVWFNASFRTIDSVVDDIELYLEMMVDTPRGPKIAEILKRRILERAESDG